jgi:hypothetical protein
MALSPLFLALPAFFRGLGLNDKRTEASSMFGQLARRTRHCTAKPLSCDIDNVAMGCAKQQRSINRQVLCVAPQFLQRNHP